MSGIRRVVVGTSGSPGSLPALRHARSLAFREDALLVAVYAWIPPGGDMADRRSPSPYMRKIWAEAAQERLAEALDVAWGGMPAGPGVHPLVMRGEPGPVLVNVAYSADDLIVVGAGRRGSLGRISRGHVGRYCLAHALCPVTAVPPPALARQTPRRLGAWRFRHRELTVEQAMAESVGAEPGRDRR